MFAPEKVAKSLFAELDKSSNMTRVDEIIVSLQLQDKVPKRGFQR